MTPPLQGFPLPARPAHRKGESRRQIATAPPRVAGPACPALLAHGGPRQASSRRGSRALLAGLTLASCLAGCHRAASHPDIILVSIDTLRADHLGCYGAGAPTSPAIDGFRREAVLFSHTFAQAPSTLPSHASMLTSLPPHQHGASFAMHAALGKGVLTLAEVLARNGYRTASFNEGGQIAPEFGLNRGFEVYESRMVLPETARFTVEVERGLAWLKDKRDQPVFLFLHSYEAHHPYTPSYHNLALVEREPYTGPLARGETSMEELTAINEGRLQVAERDRRHIMATYDGEIRSVDEAFGRLVAGLRQRGRYEDTVVIFTADHGEEFGEHGTMGWHSHTLYDELLRVPLLIKLPGGEQAGQKVTVPVRSIDIAPTVLALAGIAPPPSFRGASLMPLVLGRPEAPRAVVSRRDVPDDGAVSVRLGRWKLNEGKLFDLDSDPGELHELTGREPQIAASLAGLTQRLDGSPATAPGPPVTLSLEEKERLRALGYLQ